VWTGVTRERLPVIMPDGDNSLPDVPLGTGRTESEYVSKYVVTPEKQKNIDGE